MPPQYQLESLVIVLTPSLAPPPATCHAIQLIDLRDGSATVSLIKDWQKKLGWRPQDLAALVTSPRKVQQPPSQHPTEAAALQSDALAVPPLLLDGSYSPPSPLLQVAKIEDTLTRAEQGDLKLRVRVLESERAFKRLDIVQNAMGSAILASMCLNAAIVLQAAYPGVRAPARPIHHTHSGRNGAPPSPPHQ